MQSVGNDYHYGSDLIGHGAFAIVYKGWHKPSGRAVAIKQILLKNIPGKLSNMRQKEISILKELKHPNIVQLYDCYETRVELYIIMEFCNGGDLADYLQVKKTLSEDSIKHLSIHIASALHFIHEHHIIHRDIKPQNVLLSYTTSSSTSKQFKDASIKIADFGFARYLYEADMAATVCGSPIYMAPEILIGHRYDGKVDMWSTGVILYQCLTGSTPFNATDPHSLRKQYIRNALKPSIPVGVSPLLMDLLLKLIVKSPSDRMDQEQFKSHPFLSIQTPHVPLHEESPSLHARSSPVPINRPNSGSTSSTKSPKNSPHNGRLSYGSLKGFSASSGPPSMHKIITNPSLHKFYSSPPTNVTDEGFILVGTPGVTKQHVSYSPCSVEGNSIGTSSSKSSSSPIGSLPYNPNLLQSPQSDPPPMATPTHQKALPNLSHTPPFSSLFKPSASQTSPSLQQFSLQTTPLNHTNSASSEPSPHLSSLGSSPGKRSLPSSRQGSHSKLSTLVEHHQEGSGTRHTHMIDSMDMVTPSLLMESDILRDELNRLSSSKGGTSEGSVFGLLKNASLKDDGGKGLVRKPSKGLDLSQEFAEIREREISLSQRRLSMFQIGDNGGSDSAIVPPQRSDSIDGGEVWGRDRKLSDSSRSTSEEMFAIQLEDGGSEERPLHSLKQDILLANELLRIAKTRQGPMLLLSSSMGDSGGVVDHVVRFSEQLVLCAKAAVVLRDGVRQYYITNAMSSTLPSESHKTVLEEAEKLEMLCLEKAKLARDLYHKCLAKRRRHSLPHVSVTAEKLIFLQAADLCKQALLEERANHKDESLKKYQLANLLFKLLLSDAKSLSDRNMLKKYIDLVKYR